MIFLTFSFYSHSSADLSVRVKSILICSLLPAGKWLLRDRLRMLLKDEEIPHRRDKTDNTDGENF